MTSFSSWVRRRVKLHTHFVIWVRGTASLLLFRQLQINHFPIKSDEREARRVALFQRKSASNADERRTVQRYSVDCSARLKMPGGNRDGRLSDLSQSGARFETPSPPQQGVSGLLVWENHEFFGKVVWSRDTSCGFLFERPIPTAVVEETCDVVEVESGPVAKFDNIPVAKRGRRASLVSRDS